ncbi:MAG: hypothetical protein Q8O74_08385 [bacterium]|nr:hypothetical protein [bacterium]
MKKLLILVLLAPLFIGAAPPGPGQNTIEFWGGTGRYRRQAGCNPAQRVEYYDVAVSFKHRVTEEQITVADSGYFSIKTIRKVATPFSFLIDASMTRGTATDIIYYYDDYHSTPAEDTVEDIQAGAKLQGDWKNFGFGLGGVTAGDEGGFGMVPAGYLRIGPRDKIYLTGELLYANPIISGHGILAAGLGHQSKNLDLWAGAGVWVNEQHLRPCLTIKYHFRDMMLGLDASYGTSTQDGIKPYSISLGVGYEF